jgi:Ca-activated chloride channel family protein
MRFEYSEHLWALWLIPLLLGLAIYAWRLRVRFFSEWGEQPLLGRLLEGYAPKKVRNSTLLSIVSLLLLIIAWGNPQWGVRKETGTRKSADIMIALDVSNSMLAEDTPPSRLDKAKQLALKLIQSLKGERIGLIFFAGEAFLQLPLTTDYAAASVFVKSANPGLIRTQGTAIAQAIDLADRSFKSKGEYHKAMILITDGENHDEKAVLRAQEAREAGLFIFGIGVGTEQGGMIPIRYNFGEQFKKDKEGKPIRTRLNEVALREITDAAEGAYYPIDAGDQAILNNMKEKIDKLDKLEYEQQVFSEHESYFQLFIGLGIVLLILDLLLPQFKKRTTSE